VLADVPGDACDRRLHCQHHPLRWVDPIAAALRPAFVRGAEAKRCEGMADICADGLAVSPHAACQIDTVLTPNVV
jgi:hypothetical protein